MNKDHEVSKETIQVLKDPFAVHQELPYREHDDEAKAAIEGVSARSQTKRPEKDDV